MVSLIIVPIMKAYAGDLFDRMSGDFSGRPKVDSLSQVELSNHPGPLTPYFDKGCALYGVDDYLLNDSFFFCIDHSFRFFDFFIPGGDYEGLDYDNNSGFIFASAGDDAFPSVFNGDILTMMPIPGCDAIPIASLGPIMVDGRAMKEVDGIAFDNSGNLFGWAQEAGLFKLNASAVTPTNLLDEGEMLINQPGEVEDIEVIDGCIIGLLNQGQLGQKTDVNAAVDVNGVIKANYVVYCPGQPLQTPCETEVVNALREYQAAEIEAIEILPQLPGEEGTKILLGFHTNSGIGPGHGNPPPGSGSYNTLVLGVIDISNCSLQTQALYEIPRDITIRDNLDIEGLAMVCPFHN